MGKEERRVASTIAAPLTFAPAGEPALSRDVQNHCAGLGHGDAMAPVLPRGNARSDGHALPRIRLRQVFGLVDVELASTVRRFPGCLPSACDGGRFHIPLRGSAGLIPASLFISSLYSHRKMKTFSEAEVSPVEGSSQRRFQSRAGQECLPGWTNCRSRSSTGSWSWMKLRMSARVGAWSRSGRDIANSSGEWPMLG